jgi:hypothetical protein
MSSARHQKMLRKKYKLDDFLAQIIQEVIETIGDDFKYPIHSPIRVFDARQV